MKKSVIEALQRRLKALDIYSGEIDGERGGGTNAAVAAALAAGAHPPAEDPAGWSDLRKTVAVLQQWCLAEGVDAGKVDGLWGPQTEFAIDTVMERERTGAAPEAWREEAERAAPVSDRWPREKDLRAFYGPPGNPDNKPKGPPPPPLVRVPCPWTLKIAWKLSATRSHFLVHEKVADSLSEVLAKVHAHYGAAEIAKLGLDLFGGDYNARLKRGGTSMSMHSWGIAIDFDPANNPLKANRATARFARPEYDDWWRIWESEGWLSLGRARNFDWMHVQAARL